MGFGGAGGKVDAKAQRREGRKGGDGLGGVSKEKKGGKVVVLPPFGFQGRAVRPLGGGRRACGVAALRLAYHAALAEVVVGCAAAGG